MYIYITMVRLTLNSQCLRSWFSDMRPTAENTRQLHKTQASCTEHWSAQSTCHMPAAQSHDPMNKALASFTEHWPVAQSTLHTATPSQTTRDDETAHPSIFLLPRTLITRSRERESQREAREPESQKAREPEALPEIGSGQTCLDLGRVAHFSPSM